MWEKLYKCGGRVKSREQHHDQHLCGIQDVRWLRDGLFFYGTNDIYASLQNSSPSLP